MIELRIGFAGTPQFAASIYKDLRSAGLEIKRIFTRPPGPAGRGRKVQRTPVHELAETDGVELFTPTSLKGASIYFEDLDILVVAAYGLLLPKTVLAAPVYGCVNVHASLLPRWRGASPVEHTILHGDQTTGVSLMQMDAGLDTGPLYVQRTLSLQGDETLESLTLKLAEIGGAELVNLILQLSTRALPDATPQRADGVTYAPRLDSHDARIDWNNSATQIERRVRAFAGRGGAYTVLGTTRMRILQAHVTQANAPQGELQRFEKEWIIGCGEECLGLDIVQLNRGKGKPMRVLDAANGYRDIFQTGICLESK